MIKKYRINVHSLDENDGSVWREFHSKKDADSAIEKLNNNPYFIKLGYVFSLEIEVPDKEV